jgi:hypothetical protein
VFTVRYGLNPYIKPTVSSLKGKGKTQRKQSAGIKHFYGWVKMTSMCGVLEVPFCI